MRLWWGVVVGLFVATSACAAPALYPDGSGNSSCYVTIQNPTGNSLAARSTIVFQGAGVSCRDDHANLRTICTIAFPTPTPTPTSTPTPTATPTATSTPTATPTP